MATGRSEAQQRSPAEPRFRVLAQPAWSNRDQNPYQWLLHTSLSARGALVEEFSVKEAARGRHDVIHLHWPEWVIGTTRLADVPKALLGLAVLVLAKARGARIFWTAHNKLAGHDSRRNVLGPLNRVVFPLLLDGWFALSAGAAAEAVLDAPMLRRRPGRLLPHGHYRDVYPQVEGAEARTRLGIDPGAPHVVNLGQIRPYKGLLELVSAFRELAREDARLTIAGSVVDAAYARDLEHLAEGDARIVLRFEHLDDAEVGVLIAGADLVALPYRAVLNSGGALLALSLGRPVVGADVAAFRDLRAEVGDDWVRTFDGELSASELDAALAWAAAAREREIARPDLTAREWDRLGEVVLTAYGAADRSGQRP